MVWFVRAFAAFYSSRLLKETANTISRVHTKVLANPNVISITKQSTRTLFRVLQSSCRIHYPIGALVESRVGEMCVEYRS